MNNKTILVISLTLLLLGAVALGVCIFSDVNDQLFLPLALGLILTGNVLNLVKKKKTGENE